MSEQGLINTELLVLLPLLIMAQLVLMHSLHGSAKVISSSKRHLNQVLQESSISLPDSSHECSARSFDEFSILECRNPAPQRLIGWKHLIISER